MNNSVCRAEPGVAGCAYYLNTEYFSSVAVPIKGKYFVKLILSPLFLEFRKKCNQMQLLNALKEPRIYNHRHFVGLNEKGLIVIHLLTFSPITFSFLLCAMKLTFENEENQFVF